MSGVEVKGASDGEVAWVNVNSKAIKSLGENMAVTHARAYDAIKTHDTVKAMMSVPARLMLG